MTSPLELLGLLATVLAVAGVVLNNNLCIYCFPLWMASNGITAYLHGRKKMWSLLLRDLIFLGLAIQGWCLWSCR